ncbi:MAG: hypothetical protein QOK03_2727, partial [Candidatus Binataceae bacterium]|nr:hypothetical protein [Candidatus Binataceae bacterium]
MYFDELFVTGVHPTDRQNEDIFRPADAQIIAKSAEDIDQFRIGLLLIHQTLSEVAGGGMACATR